MATTRTATAKALAAKPAAARIVGRFRTCLDRVLVHEGGKVDHPKDPGGRTNRGVTQRVYNAYRGRSHLPVRDVWQIGDAEVESIYRTQYWDVIWGDRLPAGLDYVVFDGAVNSGPKQSIKWLQRALGSLYSGRIDGVMGNLTLAALAAVNDVDALIGRIVDRREVFLRALKTFATFGRGWMARIIDVERTGQAWAAGSVGPAPEFIAGAEAKAVVEDARQAPGKGVADGATGGGLASGGLGTVLSGAREQLEPYAGTSLWIGNLVVGLILAGVVLTAGGFAWRWWASLRAAKLADALDLEVAP